MDFHLTREQDLVRRMMKDFTENEVKPIAAETDKTSTYPRENIEKLFDLGVMGMIVPEEYGGAGADDLCSAIAIEELSKQCASTGDILATHNGLCCGPIIQHGTPEQKEKYLRMLTEGHKVGAFALTEPDAGSDAAKGTCTAVLDGDHYVLNGSKIFITNGYVADVFVVFAMTDKSKGTRGISAFIVESSFPGFSVGKHEEKLGLHGSPTGVRARRGASVEVRGMLRRMVRRGSCAPARRRFRSVGQRRRVVSRFLGRPAGSLLGSQVLEDRAGELGELVEFLRGQGVDEQSPDHLGMARHRARERFHPRVGENGVHAPGPAPFALDQAPLGHPGELMVHAALLPAGRRAELVDAHALLGGLGQQAQHAVVGVGQAAGGLQLLLDPSPQHLHHVHGRRPRTELAVAQFLLGHAITVPFEVTNHLTRAPSSRG